MVFVQVREDFSGEENFVRRSIQHDLCEHLFCSFRTPRVEERPAEADRQGTSPGVS